MKKIFLLLIMISLVTLVACGGGQVQDPNEAWVRAANSELARVSIGGFGYKSSTVPANTWTSWNQTGMPVVRRIVAEVPDGYVLQITGHADASGPELPTGNKPGNVRISSDRARNVYNNLTRNLDSPKFTHRGVGSSQPIDGVDGRDSAQRRVSFRIVQQ